MDSTDSGNNEYAKAVPTAFVEQIDARGLCCPMPLLRAKQALNRIAAGDCVRVLATDAGAARDFPAFTRLSGHTLVRQVYEGGVYEFIIQKRQESKQ